MPRGRAAGYDDQREMILARAAELFARRGYPGTSMNEVAEACGLSQAPLYHYYSDKYELLVRSPRATSRGCRRWWTRCGAGSLAPEAHLRELIARFVEEYADAQHAHRVLTEDVSSSTPTDRERVLDKEREVVAGFAEAVAALRPDLRRPASTSR